MKKLGETHISCVLDEDDAELWRVSENLHRTNMTVRQRAAAIAEWRRLRKEKANSVSNQNGSKLKKKSKRGRIGEGAQDKPGSTRDAARSLGISQTEVMRAEKIHKMNPDAAAILENLSGDLKATDADFLFVAEQTKTKQVKTASFVS